MILRARPLKIADVLLLESLAFRDERGFLMEIHRGSELSELGIPQPFVQVNLSCSARGVLRGMHYQNPPAAQGKLVHVTQGQIFDVAVDLRRGSPTYANWVGRMLSDRTLQSLYIPPGFAHGFCALEEHTQVIYWMTCEYSPDHEAGLLWNDETVGVRWPLRRPTLSNRDANLPLLHKADIRFVYQQDDPRSLSMDGGDS